MKIKHYMISTEFNLESLEEDINIALESGWQPYGNVFITPEEKDQLYCQAMVQYGD